MDVLVASPVIDGVFSSPEMPLLHEIQKRSIRSDVEAVRMSIWGSTLGSSDGGDVFGPFSRPTTTSNVRKSNKYQGSFVRTSSAGSSDVEGLDPMTETRGSSDPGLVRPGHSLSNLARQIHAVTDTGTLQGDADKQTRLLASHC